MKNTKKEIQDKITELETYVINAENTKKSYEAEVAILKKDLEDFNKPVIDDNILDQIYEIIQVHIENMDQIDPSNCEFEFEIDYDGRVAVQYMRVENGWEYFSKDLYNDIKNLFKVNKKEDEDSV